MKYIQEFWRVLKWNGKPRKGLRFEFIKTVRDYKEIEDVSFMRNVGFGWYTVTWGRRKKDGKFDHHPIENAYYKYKDGETGKITIEQWHGRFGNWKKIVRKVVFH